MQQTDKPPLISDNDLVEQLEKPIIICCFNLILESNIGLRTQNNQHKT